MQMQFSRGGLDGLDEEFELRRFIGIEYILASSTPPSLFVIHKRERTSPEEAKTIAVYYILNDNIYQSPSLYSVINERLLTSLHALSTSLNLIKEKKPTWSPETLYNWEIQPPSSSSVLQSTSTILPPSSPSNKRTSDQIEEEEEETERPATTFNPLLFSALQTVALSTAQLISTTSSTNSQNQNLLKNQQGGNLPLPIVEVEELEGSGKEKEKEKENVKEVVVGVGGSGKVEVEGVKVNNGAPRIGPTGKRKPKKAA